ncbi:MAG: acetyltransferase [Verrucomicrobia bacterium]|nr:acetyltransferase [Verrucomicrobiota bacterium]
MKAIRKLIIVGAGGFGTEPLWVANAMNQAEMAEFTWDILGFADDNPTLRGKSYCDLPILGTSDEISRDHPAVYYFHCAIGRNRQRRKVALMLEERGLKPATLIHPAAVIAAGVEVGEGSYVGAGSILAPFATIGRHVLINTLVGVGHHSLLGDFCQICPGAKINGYCRVDRFAFIGSNAALQPGISVGEGATVGANSFVVRRVEPRVTVMGVPARTISRPAKHESPA